MGKYRMNKEDLHKKNIVKKLLEERFFMTCQVTMGYATSVFHYTSPEGLMGILGRREIFFTDAQFLNDYNERLNINEDLKTFWSRHRDDYDKEFKKLLQEIRIKSYEDNEYANIDGESPDEPYRYFILSTSMNHDSLSMWKYYAKNGSYNGYNLDLFIPALVDEWIDRETGVAVEDGVVIYDSDEKQNKIYAMVEELYEIWCEYKKSEELDEKIVKEYRAWVSYASLFFKNKCFESEEELRFVAVAPKNRLNELYYTKLDGTKVKMYDFRLVNGVITPYIKMPLFGWSSNENWITQRIGVGPCMDFDQKKNGIVQFEKSLDYKFHDLQIIKSEIPLRY